LITAIYAPPDFGASHLLEQYLPSSYEKVGMVVTVDTQEGSQFTQMLFEFCAHNRISLTVFYAHLDHGERAPRIAAENVILCAQQLVIFLEAGDLLGVQLIGQFKKRNLPVQIIKIGKKD
jgi:hypothetical protein